MSFELIENANKDRIFNFLNGVDEDFSPRLSERVNLHEYSEKLASNAINFFLLADGADVGHSAFYCNDSEFGVAFISSIGVVSEFRGSGASSYLLSEIIDRCVSKKMNALQLDVDVNNARAVSFYEKHGFHFISKGSMQKTILDK